jgi:hypothetical protein
MKCYCSLKPSALGMTIGLLWGLTVLLMGLAAHYYLVGQEFVTAVGTIYFGYGPTVAGSFLGGLIGFVHGFIKGAIFAWIYNCFVSCACCGNKAQVEAA